MRALWLLLLAAAAVTSQSTAGVRQLIGKPALSQGQLNALQTQTGGDTGTEVAANGEEEGKEGANDGDLQSDNGNEDFDFQNGREFTEQEGTEQEGTEQEGTEQEGTEQEGSTTGGIEGRTRKGGRRRGNRGRKVNSRLLGLGGGGPIHSLLGIGTSLIGGLLGAVGNPNFGGGFGGRPPVGGFGPGIGGGIGPGFGGGFQPGFGGGFQPGFGGGFGGGIPVGPGVGPVGISGFGGFKPGTCPPVRPSCPPTRNFIGPQVCVSDNQCGGFDKCCFDTCLQQTVCKPPVGSGPLGR